MNREFRFHFYSSPPFDKNRKNAQNRSMFDSEKPLQVGEYLRLVNDTLALLPTEQIQIIGEISDYRISQGKWINFDLKDEMEEAKVSCFATTFQLRVPMENGMKVLVKGDPKIYERFGRFSLNIRSVELVGEGGLQKAYEMLKKRLADEGLFEPSRKRSIPRFVQKIGLITSKEAAAYGDFLRILNNRFGGIEVLHAPVHVQGQYAVLEIINAFSAFARMPKEHRPDVLVLTRGGGSLEDLHAFNDEMVARAVFQSPIPVICAVGHERDESLCDYVADIRASTPSNAAERVVPSREDVAREIDMSIMRANHQLQSVIDEKKRKVDLAIAVFDRFFERKVHGLNVQLERFMYAFERFRLALVQTRQHIERNERIAERRFIETIQRTKEQLRDLVRIFQGFDIQRTLNRGFSIARKNGRIIRQSRELAKGDEVSVQLAEGTFDAQVE